MSKKTNWREMIGYRQGNLVITDYFARITKSKQHRPVLITNCDCGSVYEVLADNFKRRNIQSCGCLKKESREKNHKPGSVYGKLTILSRVKENRSIIYSCLCECGVKIKKYKHSLNNKKLGHCGCSYKSKHDLYNTYKSMIARCFNPNNPNYVNYGGRGIKVCRRWVGKYGFDFFLRDMGGRPSEKHTLDRIDNEVGYHPHNCHWVTMREQNFNRRLGRDHLAKKTSIFRGVVKRSDGLFHAQISEKNKQIYIGKFVREIEAAKQYLLKCWELRRRLPAEYHGYDIEDINSGLLVDIYGNISENN
jgi:hypothetical protein